MRPGFKRFKGFKGGGSSGHALSGVKVQRVQRGRLTALRAEGCGRLTAAGCVRWRSGGDSPNGLRVVVAASPQFLKLALRIYFQCHMT